MKTIGTALRILLILAVAPPPVAPQVLLTGRVLAEIPPAEGSPVPLTTILCFGSLDGTGSEALAFRTWETEPVGWYRLSGSAGNYTAVFSNPAHFARPVVRTNIYLRAGERLERNVSPPFDLAVFHEGTWDEKRASDYFQPFLARGTSVTHVGFKLATDGVDGGGPGGQDILVSIHRRGTGTPDTWVQVGPSIPVINVDCGGPKNYSWSVGWNSGEVPTVPGETYAVHLAAESRGGTFQAFWRKRWDGGGCYRLGPAGTTGFQGADLWMTVATDSDGLLIPYQKRVHKQYVEFAGFSSRWSQTYVAMGHGLASVILYAAVGGAQPPLSRQRALVRVREGGPAGPVVGVEKIAVGNGNYTGDASWGAFGAAFAPGEVPLVPGRTYAIELESIENHETLHGFVNIKGQVSDDRPGFNPYRKCAPDSYPGGTAYAGGTEERGFDLDLQIVEYAAAARDWARAVEPASLLENGDMEAGDLDSGKPEAGRPAGWKPFAVDPGTAHHYLAQGPASVDRFLRVQGGGPGKGTVDGGYVQRVGGLSRLETYRLSGQIRCSWPVDVDRECRIGYDPTGQDADPAAPTIVWATLPAVHGVFVDWMSDPIRPAGDSISIWLRGRCGAPTPWPFKADFDDVLLRRVRTGVPSTAPAEGTTTSR